MIVTDGPVGPPVLGSSSLLYNTMPCICTCYPNTSVGFW